MRLRSLITALTTLALTTGVSRHASADEPSDNRAELTARAEFLEDRLATQRSHATWWWGGWLGFYTAGAIFQTYRTVEATDTSTKGAQGVSAVKAVFGITRLALQPFGGYGELAGNPNLDGLSTPELRARVDEGERVLVENVDKQSSSKAWYAHVGNVGINLLGAVIVATAFDDPAQGFIDAGIGVAVGEVHILTGPWEPDDDLEEYEHRYGGLDREEDAKDRVDEEARRVAPPRTVAPTVTIAPYHAGMMVLGQF